MQEPQAAILVVADDAVAITDAMESFGEATSESAIHAVNIIYITIASTMPDFITPRIVAGSRVDRMVTPFIDWARNYRHQHNNSPGDDNLQRGV